MPTPIKPATQIALPPRSQASVEKLTLQKVGLKKLGHRIVIYGPGGWGKTTLGCMLTGRSAYIDADESLDKLRGGLVEAGITLPMLFPATDYQSLRAGLHMDATGVFDNLFLDSGSKIQSWVESYVLRTIKRENGTTATSIEDYGYGKGYKHLYDAFCLLLNDLDSHARAGRNVIIICHDDVKTVPNPAGIDWIRWEPKLHDGKGTSIRLRVKEWADHVLFAGYDVNVSNTGEMKGKGKGSGTRTLYTAEQPHFMAKSRTTSEQFPIERGTNPWPEIIK